LKTKASLKGLSGKNIRDVDRKVVKDRHPARNYNQDDVFLIIALVRSCILHKSSSVHGRCGNVFRQKKQKKTNAKERLWNL
jgi:hypothetical protein